MIHAGIFMSITGSCRCLAADVFLSEEPPPAPEVLPIFLPPPMPPPPPPPPPRVSPTGSP